MTSTPAPVRSRRAAVAQRLLRRTHDPTPVSPAPAPTLAADQPLAPTSPPQPGADEHPGVAPEGGTAGPPAGLHVAGTAAPGTDDDVAPAAPVGRGAAAPQPDGSVPPVDGLGRVVTPTARLHVVAAHGGAGARTLAGLLDGARPTAAWPQPEDDGPAVCVLVARSDHAGLSAARRALAEWARGDAGEQVRLLGLVVVADAPGRLPSPLAELLAHLAGGAPATWRIGWQPSWRLGPPDPTAVGRDVRGVLRALTGALT